MTTKFDEYVERRERARAQRRNEEINRLLMTSLTTKTKEEVLGQMLGELTFVVGIGTVLTANENVNRMQSLVF